jgi:hypothetical protein
MKTFVIENGNNITAFGAGQRVPETKGVERFERCDELEKLAANWSVGRLVEIWHRLPGVTLVKKFRDRKTAVRRVWAAIQSLASWPRSPTSPHSGPTARRRRPSRLTTRPTAANRHSKAAKYCRKVKDLSQESDPAWQCV